MIKSPLKWVPALVRIEIATRPLILNQLKPESGNHRNVKDAVNSLLWYIIIVSKKLWMRPECIWTTWNCRVLHVRYWPWIVWSFTILIDLSIIGASITRITLAFFTDLDICSTLVAKQRGVLHRMNVFHLKTLDLAFESAIDVEKWDQALEYGNELIPGFRLVQTLKTDWRFVPT